MYSIQDLEALSGIKAHTIRIWEKRYKLLSPARTETNIRYYSDPDLKKLLNVSALVASGGKISKISALSPEDIASQVEEAMLPTESDEHTEMFINNLISSGLNFDTYKFEAIFSSALLKFGLRDMYTKVLLPMLVRIGLMWGKDEIIPAQEHLISNLIEQKLLAGIDGLPRETNPKGKYLLFLPPNENHEIGLLLTYYLLKQKGNKVFYLGNNVPISNIKTAVHYTDPDYVVFFTVRNWTKDALKTTTERIAEVFKKNIVVIGDPNTIGFLDQKNVLKISSIQQFEELF